MMNRKLFLRNLLGGSVATIVGSKLSFATPTVAIVDKIKEYPLTPKECYKFYIGDIVKHINHEETWVVTDINEQSIVCVNIFHTKWKRIEVNRKFAHNLIPVWRVYQEQNLVVPI